MTDQHLSTREAKENKTRATKTRQEFVVQSDVTKA